MLFDNKLLDKVEEYTKTKFRIDDTNLVSIDNIESMVEELLDLIDERTQKICDLQRDIAENYESIDWYDTLDY